MVSSTVQGPALAVARSIANPVSLVELSVQVSLIWLEEVAVATTLLGAAGGARSVAVFAVLENTESPAEL